MKASKEFLDKLAKILGSTTTFSLKHSEGEYEVQVFENGKKNSKRSYFTDGREDAFSTMKAMREEQLINEVLSYEGGK